MKTGEMRSSDSGKYEYYCLLGYDLVQSGRQAQVRRDVGNFYLCNFEITECKNKVN